VTSLIFGIASCHGADGKGKEASKTKNFASAAVQNMQNSLRSSPMEKGKMPAYGKSRKPKAGSG
jgi:hypothetical protein